MSIDVRPAPRAHGKRAYDVVLASIGVAVLAPVWVVIALAIKLGDGGSVIFTQERIGRGGRPFRIWKFRTMRPGAEKMGLAVTQCGDPRITPVGRWLRRAKLDELPQLGNVVRGEMSLVGPRPEVPRYVALYSASQRRVLEILPGITDPATLAFRDEELLLAQATDVESFYVSECMPKKIALNLEYAVRASRWRDTVIILRTVLPPLDRWMRTYDSGAA